MPDDLYNKKIFLNLGNSFLHTNTLGQGYTILNTPQAVRNSANKIRMFELFKLNNIRCLEYVSSRDMYKFTNLIKARAGQLFMRKGYATVREDKAVEYRIIVFKNKILKTYVKIPNGDDFVLKRKNCSFKRIRFPFPPEVKSNILNSVKCVGLDLAGVDMLINEKGEDKIIEVNSGPGMGEATIKMLYQEIRNRVPFSEEVSFSIKQSIDRYFR